MTEGNQAGNLYKNHNNRSIHVVWDFFLLCYLFQPHISMLLSTVNYYAMSCVLNADFTQFVYTVCPCTKYLVPITTGLYVINLSNVVFAPIQLNQNL